MDDLVLVNRIASDDFLTEQEPVHLIFLSRTVLDIIVAIANDLQSIDIF